MVSYLYNMLWWHLCWQNDEPNTDSVEFLKSDMLLEQPALHCSRSSLSLLSLLLQWLQQTRELDFCKHWTCVCRSHGLVIICHTDGTILVCEGIFKVSLFRWDRSGMAPAVFHDLHLKGFIPLIKYFLYCRFETHGSLFVSLLLGHVVSEGCRCSHSGI